MTPVRTKIAVAVNVPESFRLLLRAQLDAARAAGFDVHCVAGPGPYLRELAADGFRVHVVPALTRLLRPAQDVRALVGMTSLFRREGFALVHTHTPKTALIGQLAAHLADVPHVVNTVHGLLGHADVPEPRRALLGLIDRAMMALSTAVLSQSREDVETAIARRLCRPEIIRHLGQGIDLARFDPSQAALASTAALRARLQLPVHDVVVAMVARFTREKGYPEFLAMARRIADERADVHFVVVGTSLSERDAVRVDPAAHGLAGRLTVLIDRHDMPEIYRAADLMVLPTHREGFPRAAVEASAMALPVIATRIRGCREAVLDGETGVLVPPGDVAALTAAVRALVADPERRAHLGAAAAKRARIEFDERHICERVLALYYNLLGPPPGRVAVAARPGPRAAVVAPSLPTPAALVRPAPAASAPSAPAALPQPAPTRARQGARQ